jgi:membrane associated rhomboid family serine protease
LVIIALVHLYVMSLDVREANRFYVRYGNFSDFVAEGEYYRLFTSMFLHGSLLHWLFNSWVLYAFGKEIEGYFGHVRFALVYVLGGIAGSLTSFAVTQGNSIGASGAVFAVFGALVAYYYHNRKLYGDQAIQRLQRLGFFALINLAWGLVGSDPQTGARVDNAAHIGGALGGLLLAWFMTPVFSVRISLLDGQPRQTLIDTKTTPQWIIMPIIFAGAMLIAAVWIVQART